MIGLLVSPLRDCDKLAVSLTGTLGLARLYAVNTPRDFKESAKKKRTPYVV